MLVTRLVFYTIRSHLVFSNNVVVPTHFSVKNRLQTNNINILNPVYGLGLANGREIQVNQFQEGTYLPYLSVFPFGRIKLQVSKIPTSSVTTLNKLHWITQPSDR